MKKLLWVGMAVMMLLGAGGFAQEVPEDMPIITAERQLILPDKLLPVLQARFPVYRTTVKDDYRGVPFYQDTTWALAQGRELDIYPLWYDVGDSALPCICWGDFNGDSLTDVALMLIPDSTKLTAADSVPVPPLLVVFHQTKDGYDVITPKVPMGRTWINYFIRTLPPQTIKPYPMTGEEVPVTTRCDAIEWNNWEGSAYVLYWDNGEYHQIWTKD
ncbi:MAG: hypothetical protein ACOZB3_11000 [Calditrichota bacterium]